MRDGHTVVRYVRPGVGTSDRDVRAEDLTLDGKVELLRAVLDELGLEQARVGRRLVRGMGTMTQQPGAQASSGAKAVDRMPKTDAEWAALAQLPAADRSAAYLRSIRGMVLFFTVLAVVGLALSFFLGLRHGTA